MQSKRAILEIWGCLPSTRYQKLIEKTDDSPSLFRDSKGRFKGAYATFTLATIDEYASLNAKRAILIFSYGSLLPPPQLKTTLNQPLPIAVYVWNCKGRGQILVKT